MEINTPRSVAGFISAAPALFICFFFFYGMHNLIRELDRLAHVAAANVGGSVCFWELRSRKPRLCNCVVFFSFVTVLGGAVVSICHNYIEVLR